MKSPMTSGMMKREKRISFFNGKGAYGSEGWGYIFSFLINGLLLGILFLNFGQIQVFKVSSNLPSSFPICLLFEESSRSPSPYAHDSSLQLRNQEKDLSYKEKKKEEQKSSSLQHNRKREIFNFKNENLENLPETKGSFVFTKDNEIPQNSSVNALLAPIDSVLRGPEILKEENISYPEEARRQGLEGDVVLLLTIDQKGEVSKISVQKGSGWDLLDTYAMQHAKTLIFKPAFKNGKPTFASVERTLSFRLEEEKTIFS
ncbi:MAG: energy transducer TonB [Proteobacteria bacterium]|nr:energy transducer TonB [Pseudomonadota bacterium]